MYPNQNPYGQPPMYPNATPGYVQPQMGYPQPQMGYPQPQMGYPQPQMGVNPMMGNNYAYRTMNFNNYQMQRYGINPYMIKTHGPVLFRKYDRNMSGNLDIMELYPLVSEFATVNGLHQPSGCELPRLHF